MQGGPERPRSKQAGGPMGEGQGTGGAPTLEKKTTTRHLPQVARVWIYHLWQFAQVMNLFISKAYKVGWPACPLWHSSHQPAWELVVHQSAGALHHPAAPQTLHPAPVWKAPDATERCHAAPMRCHAVPWSNRPLLHL